MILGRWKVLFQTSDLLSACTRDILRQNFPFFEVSAFNAMISGVLSLPTVPFHTARLSRHLPLPHNEVWACLLKAPSGRKCSQMCQVLTKRDTMVPYPQKVQQTGLSLGFVTRPVRTTDALCFRPCCEGTGSSTSTDHMDRYSTSQKCVFQLPWLFIRSTVRFSVVLEAAVLAYHSIVDQDTTYPFCP